MQQMKAPKQCQTGLTAISLMVILVVAAFLGMIFLKLFPAYMEHFSVVSSMHNLRDDPEMKGLIQGELRTRLMKRFQINGVDRITADDVAIEKKDGRYVVNVAYDLQIPFVYNIDFLVHFDDTVEVEAS